MDYARCFHCLLEGHWQQDCPLLEPPADLKEHYARLDEFKRRFLYEGLPPYEKQRMITKENALWKERTKEMARK